MFDGVLNTPLLWLRDNLLYENKLNRSEMLVALRSFCNALFSATMNLFFFGYFYSIF